MRTLEARRYHGRCHCGAVQFEVTFTDETKTPRRCNCSLCRRRGAVAASASLDALRVTAGDDVLSCYEFNTRTAKHYFCSVCGVSTHHRRRSDPSLYGVNVACLDGVSPFDFEEVAVLDGEHHPRDTGRGSDAAVFGVLRFERAP